MGNVRRVYVEKKPDFAVKAKELKHEVKHYLGIAVEELRVLIRYDVENVSDETYQKALQTVFSEPPVDDIYEETFDAHGGIPSGTVRPESRFRRTVREAVK